jgi:hypothetical protein
MRLEGRQLGNLDCSGGVVRLQGGPGLRTYDGVGLERHAFLKGAYEGLREGSVDLIFGVLHAYVIEELLHA